MFETRSQDTKSEAETENELCSNADIAGNENLLKRYTHAFVTR